MVRRLVLLLLLAAPSLLAAAPLGARAAGDPLVVAAGDIACAAKQAVTAGACQQAATGALAAALNPDAVFVLGDEQYPCGSLADFEASYDKAWGQLKAITHPVPGNHEYNEGEPGTAPEEKDGIACDKLPTPSNAAGYFSYFGAAATPRLPACRQACGGYYSFDIGQWHIVALNANCDAVGCGEDSQQENWLKADLAAHPSTCTLAMWHEPRFSSGYSGSNASLAEIWRELYKAGVDVVLAGHDHDYERFAPLDADGYPDPATGVREFVVGTGGADHHPFKTTPESGSEKRIANQFGVLSLVLHAHSYDWAFNPIDGAAPLDAGHASCHGAPAPDA